MRTIRLCREVNASGFCGHAIHQLILPKIMWRGEIRLAAAQFGDSARNSPSRVAAGEHVCRAGFAPGVGLIISMSLFRIIPVAISRGVT